MQIYEYLGTYFQYLVLVSTIPVKKLNGLGLTRLFLQKTPINIKNNY